MSVWNDIRQKSLGREVRKESKVDPLKAGHYDKITLYVEEYNQLASEWSVTLNWYKQWIPDQFRGKRYAYLTVEQFNLETLSLGELVKLEKNLYFMKQDISQNLRLLKYTR